MDSRDHKCPRKCNGPYAWKQMSNPIMLQKKLKNGLCEASIDERVDGIETVGWVDGDAGSFVRGDFGEGRHG
jgi:hypothetical protein